MSQADSLLAKLQGKPILDLNLTIKYDMGCRYFVDVLYCIEEVCLHFQFAGFFFFYDDE